MHKKGRDVDSMDHQSAPARGIEDTEQFRRAVNGVLAMFLWKAAKYWLTVWRGAGFTVTANDDGQVVVSNGENFKKMFGDGPHLIEGLRHEMVELIRKGNEAPKDDERLKIETRQCQRAYMGYLADRINSERRRAELISRSNHWHEENDPPATDKTDELNRQLAHSNKCLAEARANVARLTRDRDEWKRQAGRVQKGAA